MKKLTINELLLKMLSHFLLCDCVSFYTLTKKNDSDDNEYSSDEKNSKNQDLRELLF